MTDGIFSPFLEELLHISHVLGTNPLLVQAGGGNTSVKDRDGRYMLVKASGTPLGAMTSCKGWVAVDLEGVRALLTKKELRTLGSQEREQQVLELLTGAIIEPGDARPSVETPLHALLDRVVMHSHAVAVNALSCHPRGESLLAAVLGERPLPPLWVSYTDPGSTLAFLMADCIGDFRRRHGAAPDVLVLENHGLFVAAGSVQECVFKHTEVLTALERSFVQSREGGIGPRMQKVIAGALQHAARLRGRDTGEIHFSRRAELVRAAGTDAGAVFSGALTPDHIVYTGPAAVFLEGNEDQEKVIEQVRAFEEHYGQFPRMLLVRGEGMCFLAPNRSGFEAAEQVAVSAVQTVELMGTSPRFLAKAGVDFILNWEAEHYRAQQNA